MLTSSWIPGLPTTPAPADGYVWVPATATVPGHWEREREAPSTLVDPYATKMPTAPAPVKPTKPTLVVPGPVPVPPGTTTFIATPEAAAAYEATIKRRWLLGGAAVAALALLVVWKRR